MVLPRTASTWWGSTVPTVGPTGTATLWVVVRFRVTVAGRIAGFRFYDGFTGPGVSASYSICQLQTWAAPRIVYRVREFRTASATIPQKWQQVWFRPWFRPTVGTDYLVAALYIGGGRFQTNSLLATPVTRNGITFVSSSTATGVDLASASLAEGTQANAVDVLFYPDS